MEAPDPPRPPDHRDWCQPAPPLRSRRADLDLPHRAADPAGGQVDDRLAVGVPLTPGRHAPEPDPCHELPAHHDRDEGHRRHSAAPSPSRDEPVSGGGPQPPGPSLDDHQSDHQHPPQNRRPHPRPRDQRPLRRRHPAGGIRLPCLRINPHPLRDRAALVILNATPHTEPLTAWPLLTPIESPDCRAVHQCERSTHHAARERQTPAPPLDRTPQRPGSPGRQPHAADLQGPHRPASAKRAAKPGRVSTVDGWCRTGRPGRRPTRTADQAPTDPPIPQSGAAVLRGPVRRGPVQAGPGPRGPVRRYGSATVWRWSLCQR